MGAPPAVPRRRAADAFQAGRKRRKSIQSRGVSRRYYMSSARRRSLEPRRGPGGAMAKTLLLADDSVTIQKVVGISLASEDIRLVTVDNGDDAVARARELRPDAILADCVMPGRSGYEVCEAIAADPTLRHIPVLLLTGTFEAFDEERAARCGAAGHIAKPFEAQTLLDEVQRLFALAASRRPAPAAPPAQRVEAERGASLRTPRPAPAEPPVRLVTPPAAARR